MVEKKEEFFTAGGGEGGKKAIKLGSQSLSSLSLSRSTQSFGGISLRSLVSLVTHVNGAHEKERILVMVVVWEGGWKGDRGTEEQARTPVAQNKTKKKEINRGLGGFGDAEKKESMQNKGI